REPRLHGPNRHVERERDFLVAKTVDLAQHERGPLIEWQPLQRAPDARRRLLARQQAIGQHLARRLDLAAALQVLVERDEVCAAPPPPPALPVPNLVDDDAVDPRPERRLSAETREGPEDAEEDFLRDVERLLTIAQQVEGEVEDGALMRGDQVGAGRL